ncbi:ABC transporter substrate-binding protein [bacterium]|nr:MAG: ABC transporter substrate-binding protein [bacterium]
MQSGAFLLPALGTAVLLGIVASEALVKAPPPGERVRITYWEGWTGFEFETMMKVVDEFNKSQDRIEVQVLSVSGLQDKALLAISGGIPPDMMGLSGAAVTQFADDRALMPLDELAQEHGIKPDQYIPAFYDGGIVRGKLYALPCTPATVALHYNRALFRKAGLDPDRPPQTDEELIGMADKITVRGSNGQLKVSGFLPTEPGWWNWMWCPLFGGRLWDGKGKITINEKDSVRGFEFAQSFAKRYGAGNIATQKGGFGNFASPQNAFLSQDVAMIAQGVWMYNFISMYNKELEWGAAPLPRPADRPDLQNPTVIEENVLCIPRGSKHPKEAFEFIAFVQSQKGMEMLCMGQKKLSPLRKVSKEFIANHPNPRIKLFMDLAYSKNAFGVPKLGIWTEYNNEINAAFDAVMLMQKTPQQAMDDVAARMQPKLDLYTKRLRLRGEL